MEDKVGSFGGEAQVGGQPTEQPEAGELGLTQIIGQDAGQVVEALGDVQAQLRPVVRARSPAWARPSSRHGRRIAGRSPRSTPGRATQRAKTNGQAGQSPARLRPGRPPRGTARRAPSSRGRRSPGPRRPCFPAARRPSAGSRSSGADPVRGVEPDPGQRLARPRPFVERQAVDPAERDPAEQLDAPDRPPGGDGEPREDLVARGRPAEILDRGDQGHVEVAGRQPRRQAARQVDVQLDRRRRARPGRSKAAWRSGSRPPRPATLASWRHAPRPRPDLAAINFQSALKV